MCIHPEKFQAAAARRFLDAFPGDPLYAIKANPRRMCWTRSGPRASGHFDTASLPEIEIVQERFPDAICHFMAPVRAVGAAKTAFERSMA